MFMDRSFNRGMMSVLPKLSNRFSAITIKIQAHYFVDIDKLILLMGRQKTQCRQLILNKRNKVIVLELPNSSHIMNQQ